MITAFSLILLLMLSIGGSPAVGPGDTGIQAPIDNSCNINRFFEDYTQKTASRVDSKKIPGIPLINHPKTQISLSFQFCLKEKLYLVGYKDSMNLYQAFNMNPINFVDPYGKNIFKDIWNADWGFFFGESGHSLWNVASLGTLNKVESQENLGTMEGLLESTGSGAASISNTITLGIQDEIYYTQMNEGAGLKNIAKGTGKGLLNITPYEEVKTMISSKADFSQKISSFFMTVSKTAGLVGMYKTLRTPTNPRTQSLENFQSRKWYLKQEKSIPKNIDESLPIKEKAIEAFEKRNDLRTSTRKSMADLKEANRLNIEEPNLKLNQIVKKYYEKGYVGDKLWEKIYNSAIKSRESVNIKMQIEQILHIFFFSSVFKE